MGLWRSARGAVHIEVVSADLTGFLSEATKAGIVLQDVRFTDPLTLRASIERSVSRHCRRLAERRGEQLKIISRRGVYWHGKRLLYRPVILAVILVLLIAVITVPRHIFFIRIEGNDSVPERYILEQAEFCGITFGAKRSLVRSEKVKNALLQKIPQLQWVGINTKGCVATITVKEKTDMEKVENEAGVASIVASHSGVISQITASKGNLVCKPGQAVREGQVLISGYTDCGLSIRATQAEGEVYAQTLRALHAVTMTDVASRTVVLKKDTRYYFKIGKNLIKLYKGSGISPGSCVKMYSQENVTLPGGFVLPIAIVKEELVYYETQPVSLTDEDVDWLESAARNYLSTQMIAGQVLTESADLSTLPGTLHLDGQYTCHEMIGVLKKEEIILPDGEND